MQPSLPTTIQATLVTLVTRLALVTAGQTAPRRWGLINLPSNLQRTVRPRQGLNQVRRRPRPRRNQRRRPRPPQTLMGSGSTRSSMGGYGYLMIARTPIWDPRAPLTRIFTIPM